MTLYDNNILQYTEHSKDILYVSTWSALFFLFYFIHSNINNFFFIKYTLEGMLRVCWYVITATIEIIEHLNLKLDQLKNIMAYILLVIPIIKIKVTMNLDGGHISRDNRWASIILLSLDIKYHFTHTWGQIKPTKLCCGPMIYIWTMIVVF